jgi:hypothetical protein
MILALGAIVIFFFTSKLARARRRVSFEGEVRILLYYCSSFFPCS